MVLNMVELIKKSKDYYYYMKVLKKIITYIFVNLFPNQIRLFKFYPSLLKKDKKLLLK